MKTKTTFQLLLMAAMVFINLVGNAQQQHSYPLQFQDQKTNFGHRQLFEAETVFSKTPRQFLIDKEILCKTDWPFYPEANRFFPELRNKHTANTDDIIYVYDSVIQYKTTDQPVKTIVTSDASGKSLYSFSQIWQNGQWVNSSLWSCTYDVSQNILSMHGEAWQNGQWVNSSLFSYTYDVSQNMLSELYQHWENSQWVNIQQFSYTYDVSGNMISELDQNWGNGKLDSWQYSITYDASGNKISVFYQHLENSQWVNYTKNIYTYNISNKLLSILFQKWENAQWVNFMKNSYTYEVNGNRISMLGEIWYDIQWGNYNQFTYIYDISGNMISEIHQNWSYAQWVNFEKYEYEFDYTMKKVIAQSYKWDGNWVPIDGFLDINLNGQNLFYGFYCYKVELYYSTYFSGIEDGTSTENSTLQIFPNPANSRVNIIVSIASPLSGTIQLFDTSGKLMKQIPTGNLSPGSSAIGMNVSMLPAGVYFLKFTGKGKSSSGKFLKGPKL